MSDPLTRYAWEDFRYTCWWAWRELRRMIHPYSLEGAAYLETRTPAPADRVDR
jgi:hypothetical protein